MLTQWPSPAKLNLFLYVTGRRADGYHQLQTLFQFLDYGDTVFITPRDDGQLDLLTPITGVADQDNLLVRAAILLREYASLQGQCTAHLGADLVVDKRLPMGGGLGGGSSNAATVLVALNHIWNTGFSVTQLAQIALQLGADVPVFVHGHAAFAQGIGELLTPVVLPQKWYLLACPDEHISTAAIFNDCELSRNTPVRPMEALLNSEFTNDFEAIVRKRFPKVDSAIRWLLEYAPSRLTGTGSCVFAEFSSLPKASKVLEQAPEWLHCFIAQGVNISPLWRAISGNVVNKD